MSGTNLKLSNPTVFTNAMLALNDKSYIFITKILEMGTLIDIELDDYGLIQNNPYSPFPIKKLKINGKYLTITPYYVDGNVLNYNDNMINFTDVFYFNAANTGNIPYASLFLDIRNVLSAYFTSTYQYIANIDPNGNGIFFNLFSQSDSNDILTLQPPILHLNKNKTILSLISPNVVKNYYLIFYQGESVKFTNDKTLGTGVTLIPDDFGTILNEKSFPVQKIQINDQYLTISPKYTNITNPNDNIITLTDNFYFLDSIANQIPFASLFLNESNNLCAYFASNYLYMAFDFITFNTTGNNLLVLSPISQ